MRYVTRPLSIEAKTRIKNVTRVGSQFSASWKSTLDLLDRELWNLGVRTTFVMQIDVTETDLKLNGTLRANARPASPAVAISVERQGRPPLLFACGKFPHWQENVRAIALGLEALRKVERYGITQANEQYAGFKSLPSGEPMPAPKMTVEEAADFIAACLRDIGFEVAAGGPATRQHVLIDPGNAYRVAAKRLHPDAGGDAALFRRLSEARALLIEAQP